MCNHTLSEMLHRTVYKGLNGALSDFYFILFGSYDSFLAQNVIPFCVFIRVLSLNLELVIAEHWFMTVATCISSWFL